ncbi:MAG: hypothetical protein QXY22_01125 [Candidatus Nitrosotenuis sp.]
MAMLFIIGIIGSAAAEIPDSIKDRIGLWASGKSTDAEFAHVLVDLSKMGIVKEKLAQNTHTLPSYGQTAFVKITGRSAEYGQTSPVRLTVTDPDGLVSEYTVPILESGTYSTLIPLRYDSKIGMYSVTAYHAGKKLPDSVFYVGYQARIPAWISHLALWWLDEKITESEFLTSIEFLLKTRVIEFADVTDSTFLNVSVSGLNAVRRGTTQDITVLVKDGYGPVVGASVFVRIEDYGESVFEEFKGVTDSNGRFTVSWEISQEFPNLKTLLAYVDVTDGVLSGSKVFTFQVYCLCGESNCKCRT